jgi:hypothetical protein
MKEENQTFCENIFSKESSGIPNEPACLSLETPTREGTQVKLESIKTASTITAASFRSHSNPLLTLQDYCPSSYHAELYNLS